jgi:hypothetical protein
MIYFINYRNNSQVKYLASAAKRSGIPCVYAEFERSFITIDDKKILLNNNEIRPGSVIYYHGINFEFPVVPHIPADTDYRLHQDFHLAQQFTTSHLYSFLYALSCRNDVTIVNNFNKLKELEIRSLILQKLKDFSFPVPGFAVLNYYDKETAEKLSGENKFILWSNIKTGMPVKPLNKERVNELFTVKSHIPLVLYEAKQGRRVRCIFYNGAPLLIVYVNGVSEKAYKEELESFVYAVPDDSLKEMGKALTGIFGIRLFEIEGILDNDNEFWFYDISFDPVFMQYKKGNKYIALKLLEMFSEQTGSKVSLGPAINGKEVRETIFNKRMLQQLFEINRAAAG